VINKMLNDLIIAFRFMQLYTHNAHNSLKGPTFFVDHEILAGTYSDYEKAYDSLIERSIGSEFKLDLIELQKKAVESLVEEKMPKSFEECFQSLVYCEKYICEEIEKIKEKCSEGTRQMIGNLADQSEVRQYKFKQRLG
jgi:DNA-binding ferritin-like protein